MNLETVATIVDHLATAIAVVVGGGWIFYQYIVRRLGQTGISIDLIACVHPHTEGFRLVFLDVVLKNTGHTRLDASLASRFELARQFDDSVQFAGSLQLRRIEGPAPAAAAHVDWWENAPGVLGSLVIPEVNLLMEYTDEDERPDFFMEPGEEYHLGNAFLLSPGTYLAKVVFVGQGKREYWSRIAQVHVE